MGSTLPKVAIAGATGFIGKALLQRLSGKAERVGLCRRIPATTPDTEGVHWAVCDLYSLPQIEEALKGVDVAVYLVHSMQPKDRLTQARFEDLDLILADNFARAAARSGVKAIVYLSGILPDEKTPSGHALSQHLRSRLEVEEALSAHGVPVTTLRAGLVVGPTGSSFQLLLRLVKRLPVLVTPAWTQTPTQPIALSDVLTLLEYAVLHPSARTDYTDVSGPDTVTYRQMMKDVAESLGKRRLFFSVPFFSPGLSRLWVSLVTGFPKALVAPLVASLRHPMLARRKWLQERMNFPGMPWKQALNEAAHSALQLPAHTAHEKPVTVKSVQRLPLPLGMNARDVALEYYRWLPKFLWALLRVDVENDTARFFFRPLKTPLLELAASAQSLDSRVVLYVTGGILLRPSSYKGRLEFRVAPDGRHVLAAIHDFVPRLPWYLYRATQALAHLWVMKAFGRHLGRQLPENKR